MATTEWIPAYRRSAKWQRGSQEIGRSQETQTAEVNRARHIAPVRSFVRIEFPCALGLWLIVCASEILAQQAVVDLATDPSPPAALPSPIATPAPVEQAIVNPVAQIAEPHSLPTHDAMMRQEVWDSHAAGIPRYLPEAQFDFSGRFANPTLLLSDVVASVYRAFPAIEQARLQAGVAAGQQMSAWGAYDVKLEGYTLNQPLGFYQTYRQGLGFARQTWWGGYLGAGYRLGRGNFEPWYKERQTNEGGEFKLSWLQPLMQGRAIDAQRVELFQANLRRQAVTPEIQSSILETSLAAAEAYWSWVASGTSLRAQFRLLELAEIRGRQLDAMLKAQRGKEIEIIVNDQLIADRRGKVVESEQKLWSAASKLSLYLRDESGRPLLPPLDWLPADLAVIVDLPSVSFEEDLGRALARRPELALIDYEVQMNRWDINLANNQLLPNVDFTVQGSQDTGEPTSSLRDKSQFELEAGLVGGVPIQRRKPRGKIQEKTSKIAQLEAKRRWQQDKIGVELQIAQTSLFSAAESIKQAQEALDASQEMLRRYRIAFEQQQFDLLLLNVVETKVTESEIKLIEQEQKWYSALAAKQAALGLDPLEQAMSLEVGNAALTPPENAPTPQVPQP